MRPYGRFLPYPKRLGDVLDAIDQKILDRVTRQIDLLPSAFVLEPLDKLSELRASPHVIPALQFIEVSLAFSQTGVPLPIRP